MKKTLGTILICLFSGAITLIGYKYLIEKPYSPSFEEQTTTAQSVPQNSNHSLSNYQADFTGAAESTVNAVVHVKNLSYVTTHSNPLLEFFYGYKGGTQAQIGTGSGVIIAEDGYIVTNNHVIANASELEVTLNDNQSYKAKLIGTDKQMDIALLKIEAKEKLPHLIFGDSDQIKLGEWVLAVGNPYNLTSTVTAGIISAKARSLSKTGIQSFIQTDAVVNPGNSGGALVNASGELIGINTLISSNTGSYVGYSFAVPSNIVKKIVEDLLEYGNVQNGVLGVSGFEINNMTAKQLNTKTSRGFYVQSIVENSGAQKSGIQTGDIISAINGKNISSFVDIKNILNTKRPNDVVTVKLLRGETEKTIEVALIKAENNSLSYNGFEFENLTPEQRANYKIKYGVKITKVTNEKYLAYKDELEGALLLSVNNVKINSVDEACQLLSNQSNQQRTKIEILNSVGEYIRLLI